MKCRRPHSAM